jgi:orotate phosphoribosyltransferase
MSAALSPPIPPGHDAFRGEFVDFAIRAGVLRFGEFKTKAGRLSPYFFNAGLFDDGAKLGELGRFYARAALASAIPFDMLFGPAYKGITLAAATAVALAGLGHNVPFCFNRKEAKDHGEGGSIVGAPMQGRVLIIDDVITDGASKREAIEIIRAAGATPAGVLIALDRQERGQGEMSATQEVSRDFALPVTAIATLADIMETLRGRQNERGHLERIEDYRGRYGVAIR